MIGASARAGQAGEWQVAAYEQQCAQGNEHAARHDLIDTLAGAPESEWLSVVRALVLRSHVETAYLVLSQAIVAYPASVDLRYALAGIQVQRGEPASAQVLLLELLAEDPTNAAATFLLAGLLSRQGRLQAAANALKQAFGRIPRDAGTIIRAVEMLDDFQRTTDAASICESQIAGGCADPRIHAYAGMLNIKLGQFERARTRYAFALAHSPDAVEWNIPIGLSSMQRYENANHSDFQLFHDVLKRPDLSEHARMTTLFALGKAYDDIKDYAQAADCLRQANALAHAHAKWSRKRWRRIVEARLTAKPAALRPCPPQEWTPLFIVGVPRSGSTLLAELLGRHPLICNRGELGGIAQLARELERVDTRDPLVVQKAAANYLAQLRQDDGDGRWFIDKQPLNLLHVDLILALWPDARIIHCRRSARDTALSIWSQSFHDEAHDYAYDFEDIAALMRGCDRLLDQALARHETSIQTVSYAQLVIDPASCLDQLLRWLGLPACNLLHVTGPDHAISTASAWQARQPVYTHSRTRWRSYAEHVPELLRFSEE